MLTKRELVQPLLSEHRRYRCFNVGTCELRSTCRSDDTMTDIEEDVLSVGQEMTGDESSEPSPLSQLQLAFPGLACGFPSCSDAPACASLVRVVSAKSSLLVHVRADDRAVTTSVEKRVKDIHPRSRRAVPLKKNCTGAVFLLAVGASRIPVSRLTHGVCSHTVSK